MDEHEEAIYTLMMEALDGELADAGWVELESHLRVRPDLAREWHAIQAIDHLFRSTPALSPAADFTERTLARLPNRRARLWFVGAIYIVLLLIGLIPVALLAWLGLQFLPALLEPAIGRGLLTALGDMLRVMGLVLTTLLASAGSFVRQQPSVLGWLLVMLGVVTLWFGVYRQLVLPSGPVANNHQNTA